MVLNEGWVILTKNTTQVWGHGQKTEELLLKREEKSSRDVNLKSFIYTKPGKIHLFMIHFCNYIFCGHANKETGNSVGL